MPPAFLSKLVVSCQRPKPLEGQGRVDVGIDWLSAAITLGNTVTAAGQFAPFPYVANAAGLLVALLKPVQVPFNLCSKLGISEKFLSK